MMKFEIDYFADKSVKSYVAIKNGIQFGPKLVFHETSNLKSCESEYSGPSGFTVDLVESATKEIVDAGQRIISADTWVSFSMDSGVCEAGCRGQ
jgi:hypothetical protein